jgi:hypothetical protein
MSVCRIKGGELLNTPHGHNPHMLVYLARLAFKYQSKQ